MTCWVFGQTGELLRSIWLEVGYLGQCRLMVAMPLLTCEAGHGYQLLQSIHIAVQGQSVKEQSRLFRLHDLETSFFNAGD